MAKKGIGTLRYWEIESEIGPLTAVESGRRLTHLLFGRFGSEETFRETLRYYRFASAELLLERTKTPLLTEAEKELDAYFARRRTRFDLPLTLIGTPFQRSVWNALIGIPFGTAVSYGEIARRIGRPSAVRAVGGAIHRNPIAIIVPCHRVIGSNGHLTGYAAGLDKKSFLLDLEGVPFDL